MDEDGEPIDPEPGEDERVVDGWEPEEGDGTGGGRRRKVYVDGVRASVIAERVEYLDEDGKLVTESLKDFTKRALRKRYSSLDAFLTAFP